MLAFYLLVSWSRQVCAFNKNNKNIILLCMQMTQNTMMTMNYSKHNSNNVNIIQNDLLINSHLTIRHPYLSFLSLPNPFLQCRLVLCVSPLRQRWKTNRWIATRPHFAVGGVWLLVTLGGVCVLGTP